MDVSCLLCGKLIPYSESLDWFGDRICKPCDEEFTSKCNAEMEELPCTE